MKLRLDSPYRHDPLAAIRLLADEEIEREKLAAAMHAVYCSQRRYFRVPAWLRFTVLVTVVFLFSWLFVALWPAHADTIFVGQLHHIPGNPGETIKYDFSLTSTQRTIISAVDGQPFTFLADTLVGSMFFRFPGGQTSTWNFGDTWEFGLNEFMIPFQFGIWSGGQEPGDPPLVFEKGYEFILNAQGGQWIFVNNLEHANNIKNVNEVKTPEPGVIALLCCGLLLLLAIGKPRRKSREYLSSHPYRKSA